MKKVGFIVLILVASFLLIAATHSYTRLARLTLINKTEETLQVRLRGGVEVQYFWNLKPGTQVFTVERREYRLTVWGCDDNTSKTLDIDTAFRVTFPACNVQTNGGVPKMVKVHLHDDD